MKQTGKAVGFGGFSFELSDAQFQRVIFTAQIIVIFLGASQREVVAPSVSKGAEHITACPLKGRHRSHRPGTNQASLGIAFDLHGEEKDLEENDSREQNQRLVTRGDGRHKIDRYQFTVESLERKTVVIRRVSAGKNPRFPFLQNTLVPASSHARLRY